MLFESQGGMKKFLKLMHLRRKCGIVIMIILRKAGDKMADKSEDKDKDLENTGAALIHEDIVRDVRSRMPSEEDLIEVAELFKAFGDFTRAKIICALSQSEMCVGDISGLLEMNQSAVSHQLRMLKQARLVKTRRDGKIRYYSLADEHILEMFNVAFAHILEE